jgi:hypothetical protein
MHLRDREEGGKDNNDGKVFLDTLRVLPRGKSKNHITITITFASLGSNNDGLLVLVHMGVVNTRIGDRNILLHTFGEHLGTRKWEILLKSYGWVFPLVRRGT